MYNSIWVKKTQYFYYDSYDTFEQAKKVAKLYKGKKHKGNKYHILLAETGFMFPATKYRLYMTKVMRLL